MAEGHAHRQGDTMSEAPFMFFALSVPGVDPAKDDPDSIADDLVRIMNTEWPYGTIQVSAIPSPQWLTATTLANLRASAKGTP
jgi:hypothetical protein